VQARSISAEFVPFGAIEELEKKLATRSFAAFIVEPFPGGGALFRLTFQPSGDSRAANLAEARRAQQDSRAPQHMRG
jgi:hypothetical protein